MNTVNQINQRVFTIVGRRNTIALVDNKPNADGRATATSVHVAEGQMDRVGIKVLTELVARIPVDRLDKKVAILLPSNLAFLTYEDTRSYWLVNGVKKNGTPVSTEVLEAVAKLDATIKAKIHNVYFLDQRKLTSPYYKAIVNGAWKYMDTKEAPYERKSSMDF